MLEMQKATLKVIISTNTEQNIEDNTVNFQVIC